MNLFETIRARQPNLPGWCTPEKAEALAAIVVAMRSNLSLEIGIFGGSSFIPIALAHKHVGRGVAIGIDPWSASEAARNEQPANVDWCNKQDYEAIYQNFLGELARLSLKDVTQIIRQPSNAVAPPEVIDLLHIDGSHTQQAVTDVWRFAVHVRPGGFCVMDDIEWSGGHVKRAVSDLVSIGFRHLYPLGTGAVFQR